MQTQQYRLFMWVVAMKFLIIAKYLTHFIPNGLSGACLQHMWLFRFVIEGGICHLLTSGETNCSFVCMEKRGPMKRKNGDLPDGHSMIDGVAVAWFICRVKILLEGKDESGKHSNNKGKSWAERERDVGSVEKVIVQTENIKNGNYWVFWPSISNKDDKLIKKIPSPCEKFIRNLGLAERIVCRGIWW